MSDFLAVNGTTLHVERRGAGEAVVLLHGFTLDVRMWDAQYGALARAFDTVRYDLRGFGRSALPTGEPYSHVEDLRALLDALGIERAHLVGLSMGGAVAIDFALTYPQRARSLALIDTVVGGFDWSPAQSARDAQLWERASEGGIPAAKESWLAHPLFEPAMKRPEVAAPLTRIIEEYSGWHFVNPNPALAIEPPAAQRLGELRMPVLALVGALDSPDFVRVTERIGRELPHARTRVLPNVGHMATMEAPETVTTLLLDFLASARG